MSITHQYTDSDGQAHIEITHDDSHVTFVVIAEDTITVHSTSILQIEPRAVNKIEIRKDA